MRATIESVIICLIIASGLLGCMELGRRQVILHPIEKSDIFSIPAGAVFVLDPNSPDSVTVEKDGWFLSDTYVQEVMAAKIK